MNIKQAVAAALQAFVVFGLLGASLLCFLLPSTPAIRVVLSDLLIHQPEVCTQAAIWLLGAGLFFLAGFFWINSGYYLILKMGKNTLAIDEKILWQTVGPILERRFASQLSLEKILIQRGKKLQFGLGMAPMSDEAGEKLLEEAEEQLEMLLRERFGYRRPFTVQVSTRAT